MNKICNYCNREVERFVPYRSASPDVAPIPHDPHVVGSDLENLSCPHCASTDRERHLKLYCEVLAFIPEHARVLHFSPEPRFVGYLSTLKPEIHVLADIAPLSQNVERIDIEHIPYSDESFDLVIANHVLEHVQDPERALVEINRVLKADGVAILQTPYSTAHEETQEDPSITSPDQRLALYGQEDHVRLFGRDIFDRFARHLTPDVSRHEEVLGEITAHLYGVNSKEPLFLYRKKTGPSAREVALLATPRGSAEAPMVSILCVTYNHAEFIAETIRSFFAQKVSFPIEILIGDDCSEDNTIDVIEKVSSEAGFTPRVMRHPTNIGMHRNGASLFQQARGRYIAICDGDDYWTDTCKLQKQVDFLESHPDVVITYGSVNCKISGLGDQIDYSYSGGVRHDLTPDELKCATPLNTLSCTFRNVITELPDEFLIAGTPDLFLWSLLGWHGRGCYMRGILPSIYRQHSGGAFSQTGLFRKLLLDVMTSYSLAIYYRRLGVTELVNYFHHRCSSRARKINAGDDPATQAELDSLPDKMARMARNPQAFDKETLASLIGQHG